MEINYNVTSEERKALIQALGELLEVKPKYLGAPSFSYELGDISVDKQGTVLFKEDASQEDVDRILDGLLERGFECVVPDSFVIELPREGISDLAIENLKQIVEGKAELIKKALGADALEITVTEDKIGFPWFKCLPAPEELSAYARFVGHLVLMAKTLQRVNTTTKTVENEKYAFRCFLLRLGFIGEEYKKTRKVLLKNLSGSSAFKSGAKDKEVSE
ncbi:hypothetical protein EAL2_c05290 [Peptoclostridium acidaminophilum DSM 3953]|uniref:Virulence protein n=1 Tax=Peptoclostridium acidaminophilum DSM 3953 TaxID=1286171 RepID=W8U4E4_PEPAC|nr:hypothetical protein [Peptoclostridium acidaminophilum]AHM55831.1 hypothetical protein EAL2_c05290 [Peptoclostridium acidaminophilum DSM 3953]NLI93492.1 virulence protein [Peptococcaceae bacterium]